MTPVLPFTSKKVAAFINSEGEFRSKSWDEINASPLKSGTRINKPEILFKKIDDDVILQEIEKLEATVREAMSSN